MNLSLLRFLVCLFPLVFCQGGASFSQDHRTIPPSDAGRPGLAVMHALLDQYEGMTYDELLKAQYDSREFVADLSFDPTESKYFDSIRDKLKLTDAELEIYRRQGFVSVDHNQRHSFGSAYYQIYAADLPVFITTDSILNAMHQSFDKLLVELEMYVMSPNLNEILTDCHETLAATSVPAGLQQNQRDVDLYLTIARNLLADQQRRRPDDTTVSQSIPSHFGQDEQVKTILQLIREERIQVPVKDAPTKIYGGSRHVDYSQFKPRGHYTLSQGLSAYFRCMMWLSRADCGWFVLPTDPHDNLETDPDRELRNASMLALSLDHSGQRDNFESMSRLLADFVGASDNLMMTSLSELLKRHGVASADDLSNHDRLDALATDLAKNNAASQMIRSQALLSPDGAPYTMPPPALVQMFGQAFVIDSFVLSNVVFDSIFYNNEKVRRMMPTGLDVMAALGNDEALLLLQPELEKWHYSGNLMAATEFVDECRPEFWESRLYNVWLDALRELDTQIDPEHHVPETLRTRVWQKKQLQTQLASWSELRHDTVLIAKQSFTGVPGCEYPAGYVEPYPVFYRKLATFADRARHNLASLYLQQPDVERKRYPHYLYDRHLKFFGGMIEILMKLEAIAQKELAAKALTPEEESFLEQTIDRRGSVGYGSGSRPRYDGWFCDLIYKRPEILDWSPTIADVHTFPNRFGESEALEVGIGDTNFIVIAVDCKEKTTAYVGPVYSYYEFTQLANNRLTDETWQRKIATGQLPQRPEWTQEFQGTPQQRTVDGLSVAVQNDEIHLMFTSNNRVSQTRAFANTDAGVEQLVNAIIEQQRTGRLSLDLSRARISEQALDHLEKLPGLSFVALPHDLALSESTRQFRENRPDVQVQTVQFKISRATLCQNVSGYDLFETLPDEHLQPGDDFYVYLKVQGVISSSIFGTHTTSLQMTYELIDSQGRTVDQQELPPQQQRSEGPPRHVYISQSVKLPEKLAAGEYQLKVRISNAPPNPREHRIPIPDRLKRLTKDSVTEEPAIPSVETTFGIAVSKS